MKAKFTQPLISWYRSSARDLPWRRTRDPYAIWISEIMLQQTTVAAVIPYYKRWMKKFPDVKAVADAGEQKILKAWQGLGYYTRARNIHKAAKMICRDYGGRIPSNAEELRKLPGFGPYTTGAVLSIAFDRRAPIIDANVRRVVMRQLAVRGKADNARDPNILDFLDKVMPQRGNRIFNQALMELGALICRSRQPLCLSCPARANCRAYFQGIQELIPAPRKTVLEDVAAVVAVIRRGDKVLIQKRPATGLLAGLWEFPGGKIEKGESARTALRREVREELGVDVTNESHLLDVQHFYTRFRVSLSVWNCVCERLPSARLTRKWVNLKQLHKFPFPSGSARIVDFLLKKTTGKSA